MPLPTGSAEITAIFRAGQSLRVCASVFGATTSDVVNQTAVNNLSLAFAAAYKGILHVDGSYIGLRVLVGNDGDPFEFNSTSGAGAGTRNTNLTTPQVQGLIKKGTALAGRRNRGRTFIPDIGETEVDSVGNLTSAAITRLQAFADLIKADLATTPFSSMALIHQGPVVTVTPVSSYLAESKVATLRPRYNRSGL